MHTFLQMQELFLHNDLFTCLVAHCPVADLESLYQCTNCTHRLLNSPAILTILTQRFVIPKTFLSFHHFLQEYNHRFCRQRCPNQNTDYHLLWAVVDNDIETMASVIETYSHETRRYENFDYYRMYFQAGYNENHAILQLLQSKLRNCLPTELMFFAGMAYVGKKDLALEQFNSRELSLVLFEAIRGGNESVAARVRALITDQTLIMAVTVFASVAADDLASLIVTLKNLSRQNNWRKYKIPVLSHNGNNIAIFDSSECTVIDEMILFALHYRSEKVLNFLAQDYTLSDSFKEYVYQIPNNDTEIFSRNFCSVEGAPCKISQSCWAYRWINAHMPLDTKIKKELLYHAMNADDLSLVKELRAHLNTDRVPEYFEEIVDNNCYRVVAWLLQEFQYDPTELNLKVQNRTCASRMVRAYLEL